MPGLTGIPADVLNTLPIGTTVNGIKSFVLSHSDLFHLENRSCTPSEVADVTSQTIDVVKSVLEALSRAPGCLANTDPLYLFLANPVWTKPGISYGDNFIFVCPQAIFSHIHEVIREIAVGGGLEQAIQKRRANYLENKLEEVIRGALPSADIRKNVKWKLGAQQFETDMLAIVDRTVFLAEAKSHRISPAGLRGSPDKLKKHITGLVIDPSMQSERLASMLIGASLGDAVGQAVAAEIGIDASAIDQIVRVSITLDDLSVLSSSEDDIRRMGWIPENHVLAPSLHIADLICISEILDDEALFIHYFSERIHFQKQFNLFGDELDFLGVYLSTGFNLGPEDAEFKNLMITGMSGPIDRYYEAKEVGIKVKRPRATLHRSYRQIIDKLLERKEVGWSTICIHLLNSANSDEQRRISQDVERLRRSVLRNKANPGKVCFVEIRPPLQRKGRIGFYVYPVMPVPERRENMEQLALGVLATEGVETCVVFGKNVTKWADPYEAVLIAKHAE